MTLDIYTDGACSGNPGPAGVGVVILQDGKIIQEISRPIGEATNNIAEYTALIIALEEALKFKADEITVYTDSELMHRQVTGIYKVKHDNIVPLVKQVNELSKGFKQFRLEHVRREGNVQADKLSKAAIRKSQLPL